ncbi:DUF4390 domain-containing protein [Pseudomonadota bacterium]
MPLVFRIYPKSAAVLAVLFGMFIQINTALSAPEPSLMEITYDDKLIYCSVDRVDISDKAILALNQGTPVTFIWNIIIEEVSDYWLNSTVGEITIARQAVPDLISKSLIISDAKNRISRRVGTIDDAIEFLSGLNHFPILDRSLLKPGVRYNIQVQFHIQEGQFSDEWWSGSMSLGTTVAEEEITLP